MNIQQHILPLPLCIAVEPWGEEEVGADVPLLFILRKST